MLTSGTTPASVKLKVITTIFEIAGVSKPEAVANGRSELVKFLQENKLDVKQLNINVQPPQKPDYDPKDVVDGEIAVPELPA